MSANGYILHYELPALYGFFAELKPTENPITTLIAGKGIKTVAEKVYGMTYHTNWEATTLANVNLKPDNSSPTYGSTEFSSGSNVVQVWDEGAAVTFARTGDQRLSRVLGYTNPSNPSIEPNPMARGMVEAMERIKSGLEYVSREGTYLIGHGGTTSGTTAVWMQRGYRYADGLTVGTATGAVPGAGTLGTYGTLSYSAVMDNLQTAWEKRLWTNSSPLVCITGAVGKRQITEMFKSEFNFGKNGMLVNVSGVNMTRFLTDFGNIDILLTHNFPAHDIYFLNLDYMQIVARPVPGKPDGGVLFVRDIPETTSATSKSIYGELGVDYMTGSAHLRIIGVGSTVVGGVAVS